MVSHLMSEGRLFGLTASGWSVLLGSFMVCALLTLIFDAVFRLQGCDCALLGL
jgi:hypothetical protein